MIYLRSAEAAALLGIGPGELRDWTRRYGFPSSERAGDARQRFVYSEIVALRDALGYALSVSSAVAIARASVDGGDAESLFGALVAFDHQRCGRILHRSAGVRPLGRAIEDVLVRALEMIARAYRLESEQWAFAARFATGWLRGMTDTDSLSSCAGRVLIANAVGDELDPAAVYVRSLELLCRRVGLDVVDRPIATVASLGEEIMRYHPAIVLIAGAHRSERVMASWSRSLQRPTPHPVTALYRVDSQRSGALRPYWSVLPAPPLAAQRRILELIDRAA